MNFTGNPRDNPENANLPTANRPETILGTTITFLLLAFIAMSLRLWVRFRDSLWGWDDAFIFLAGVTSIIGDCMVCLMPGDGLGLHLWTLDAAHLISYFKHVYTTNILYCISATFIKLSILFQYLRLFEEAAPIPVTRHYRLARYMTISMITLCSAWGLSFAMIAIFPCNPVAKSWNLFMPGKCFGFGSKKPEEFFAMFVGHSASNMTLDLMVLLLPLPFLGMLRLAGRSKAGLITLFTLGCIVASVAIGRVISLSVTRAGTVPVIDMPYHTPTIYIFSVLEVNIAIVAASIPIFWPVIATIATNKIWVVNEIEVHVEETSRGSFDSNNGIGLEEQSSWKQDQKEGSKRLSIVSKAYDRTSSRQNHGHRHKPSTGSFTDRRIGHELGTRVSQDSQRMLYRGPSIDINNSNKSLTRTASDEWNADLQMQNVGGRTTTKVISNDTTIIANNKALER